MHTMKNFKIKKFEKKCFWRFSMARSEGKKECKNHQIHTCGFHCVAKHIKKLQFISGL